MLDSKMITLLTIDRGSKLKCTRIAVSRLSITTLKAKVCFNLLYCHRTASLITEMQIGINTERNISSSQ
jgi:hypothetical protein